MLMMRGRGFLNKCFGAERVSLLQGLVLMLVMLGGRGLLVAGLVKGSVLILVKLGGRGPPC